MTRYLVWSAIEHDGPGDGVDVEARSAEAAARQDATTAHAQGGTEHDTICVIDPDGRLYRYSANMRTEVIVVLHEERVTDDDERAVAEWRERGGS